MKIIENGTGEASPGKTTKDHLGKDERVIGKFPKYMTVAVIVVVIIAGAYSQMGNDDDNGNQYQDAELPTVEDVSLVRGLDARLDVPLEWMEKDDLHDFILNSFTEVTYLNMEHQDAVFTLMGFKDPDTDLEEIYLKSLEDVVLGMYDELTESMYMVKGFSDPIYRITLAHELTHALQDQNFGILEFLTVKTMDERMARLGVVEGDAKMVEYSFMLELSPDDMRIIQEEHTIMSEDVEMPDFLMDYMSFPYIYGYEFVLENYRIMRYTSVNNLYTNPPATAEQVLHPEKYFANEPAKKVDSPLPPGDFIWQWEDTLGEYIIFMMLADHLDQSTAVEASSGWGGDKFSLYTKGDSMVGFLNTTWDTTQDADEFENALLTMLMAWEKDSGCWMSDDLYMKFCRNGNNVGLTLSLDRQSLLEFSV